VSAEQLRLRRAGAQLLHCPPGGTPESVVKHLLAVQAQDLRAARLALRARAPGLSARDVDRALTDERSLVVAWLCRGTLHLVNRDDYPWLLALTAPTRMRGSRRRLGQLGVSPDAAQKAMKLIERALADEGPLTRPQLAERLDARGIRTEGQAIAHLAGLAGLLGIALLGPITADGDQAFALTRDWLGEQPNAPDRDRALKELAQRYLAGHAPAGDTDLASWSGLPLRDVRTGLSAANPPDREPPDHIEPRLLPAFDPYLLGWKDRSFAVPSRHARTVHPGGGMVRATAIDAGAKVVATWTSPRSPKIEPFGRLSSELRAALEADAEGLARF
jgi:winged helix DNA-binding protein